MIFNKNFDFSFDESACAACGGKCCTGESGNIFVSKDEITSIAKALNLDESEFRKSFLRKVGFRLSLKEVPFEGGFACIFFDKDKRNCAIYENRPAQCRSFPFWEYFKTHKEELKKECMGVCF